MCQLTGIPLSDRWQEISVTDTDSDGNIGIIWRAFVTMTTASFMTCALRTCAYGISTCPFVSVLSIWSPLSSATTLYPTEPLPVVSLMTLICLLMTADVANGTIAANTAAMMQKYTV